ncbi:MAG: RloB domain-containing protein [Bacteroidales bacterium]|nr:RloB domain-containing protein [Bacteroidales bacterium]
MEVRELAEVDKRPQYFDSVPSQAESYDSGTREMGELYPFLICGGANTERFYFTHVNDITEYKFNIRPRYFGNESNYTESFPKIIREILDTNNDAKVFCVFDWETVFGNNTCLKKHQDFENQFNEEIDKGIVTICRTMPCIEYWFLLHFVDCNDFMRDYGSVANKLAPFLKPCFPDLGKPLKKIIKSEKYLRDSKWVEELCADGKLDLAVERAERTITASMMVGDLENHSYSFVYLLFKR